MKTVHVVAAIIVKNNKVFSTQRGYGEFTGKWEFPGGKIEENETPEEALKREILEELNVHIKVIEYLDTIEYDYPQFHLSMRCYQCSLLNEHVELKEHLAAKWLTKEQLFSINWLPADLKIVTKLSELLK